MSNPQTRTPSFGRDLGPRPAKPETSWATAPCLRCCQPLRCGLREAYGFSNHLFVWLKWMLGCFMFLMAEHEFDHDETASGTVQVVFTVSATKDAHSLYIYTPDDCRCSHGLNVYRYDFSLCWRSWQKIRTVAGAKCPLGAFLFLLDFLASHHRVVAKRSHHQSQSRLFFLSSSSKGSSCASLSE